MAASSPSWALCYLPPAGQAAPVGPRGPLPLALLAYGLRAMPVSQPSPWCPLSHPPLRATSAAP